MKILPNGLNPIIDIFKSKLTDGNKSIVRLIISLLGKFIDALNANFKQFAKPIALNLIPNLADKMQILRDDVNNLLDKWVEKVGFETIVVYVPQFLKTENADIRTEILKFFDKYKSKFNKNLVCLQDRSSSIRASAEEVLKFSLKFVNVDDYLRKIKDFKPAIQKDLKNIIDKISKEIQNENENEEENKNENKNENKSENKSENKNENKSENKNENKNENKTENKNENKSENKTDDKKRDSKSKEKKPESVHKDSDSIDNININNEVKKNNEESEKPKFKKINSLSKTPEKPESNDSEKKKPHKNPQKKSNASTKQRRRDGQPQQQKHNHQNREKHRQHRKQTKF